LTETALNLTYLSNLLQNRIAHRLAYFPEFGAQRDSYGYVLKSFASSYFTRISIFLEILKN